MKFSLKKLVVVSMTFIATSLFLSCGEDSGLGSSVDTESPKLTIEYPPSKAAINGSFVFAGTCSDDKGVTSVKITVKNIDSGETVKEAEATVKDSLTWQITINEETDTGWELPDGNYEIFATAYDKAGRNSGFSSSRQFEIDNTPPVFVITKPGVTRSSFTSSKSYQKYGSLFTISGTIGDDHGSTVSSVDVIVYDKDGNPIETDSDSKPLVFIEEDVEISGGVNVTIAQATDGDESKKARYEKIYSVGSDYDDNGTKVYSCTITVADQTLEYKNPEDSGSGSGNSTSVVYFNSGDFYDKYLSSKKGYGLDVSDLKKVVNGTATDDTLSAKGVTVAEVQSALASAAVDTSDVINKSLMFSLNPNANPTYTISGFTLSYDDAGTALSSSTNKAMGEQPFTVIVSAGLDQTSIVPSSLKVWIKKIGSAAGDTLSKTELSESITSLAEAVAKKEAAGDTDFSTTAGWTLILDNSSDTSANDTTVSLSCEIPGENFVESDAYYAIVVTGQDQDDIKLSQSKTYGFVGSISAVPPSVSITSPNNLAYYATSKSKYSGDSAVSENEALVFSGSAVENNSGMALKGLTAKITVTDESTSSTVAGAEVEVSLTGDSSHAWTTANGFTCVYDAATKKNNWTFTPSLCDSYEKIKAESAGLSRLYTFTITATGSGGLTTSDSRSIHIDTTRPTVTISSITPTVSGSEYFGESHGYKDYTFLNGSISIKGSVDESNLKEVTYDVRVSTDLTKALTADDSILAGLQSAGIGNIDGSLGRTFSISQTFDTSLITQFLIAKGTITKDEPVQAEIIVTAEDTVGNQGQYSSKEGNGGKNFIIYQETDRPKITLGNGDVTVTSADDVNVNTNLFGTTNNNKLQLTFTDDDSVNSVFVTVYDEAGNKLDSSKISSDYGANPYSYSPKKSSYSLNYTLPGEEGVYQVRVDAYDENLITTDLSDSNSVYQNTVGKFFVAVDSGAPVIEVTSPADGSYEGETVNLKVTVTKNLEPTAELYRPEDSGSYTKVSDFATVADADGNKVTKVKEGEYTWIGKVTIPEITQGSGNRDGNYKIIVKAVDKYGQTSSKEREFKVDANPPEIGAPDTSDDNPVNLDTTSYVSITSVMEDSPAGIATARYFLSKTELTADELKSSFEAGNGWTQMNKGSANYNASVNVSAFNEGKDGTVYAYVAASDNAGNIGVNATPLKLELDEMAPAIVVKDFAGSGTVANNGTSTTNVSTKAFNVAVTDTNLKSLTSSNASVTVGTGSKSENVTTYPVTVTWTELATATGKHEDEKTVTFTAEDEHSRKTSQTVTLKCDDYAPRVEVAAYADFATASFEIKGTVSDVNFSALGTKLKAYLVPSGSDIADSAKSGNVSFGSVTGTSYPWTAVFTGLDEGTYLLAIVAEDSFGNVSYWSVAPSKTTSVTVSDTSLVESLTDRTITVDTKAPDSTIEIELSEAGKVLDSSHAEVTASSSGKYSLTFGKIYYTNGTFTLGGDIDEGNLDLTDGKAPSLTVSKDGGIATSLSFTTGGRDAGAWTYVPNYATDGSADGSYEYTLTLNDKAGQNFSKSVTVIVDTKVPTLLFTSPNKDDESFESEPSAKIAYSDDGSGINLSSVAYKVYDITGSTDGTEIESSNYSVSNGTATGSVTFNSNFTSEGSFKITAQVEDYLGHKSELPRTFYYDKGKPTVTEKNVGESGLSTNGGTEKKFTLSGEVSDTNALYYNGEADSDGKTAITISATVNGSEKTWKVPLTITEAKKAATWKQEFVVGSENSSAENYLPDGSYTFAIVATDVANKTTQISRTVRVDTVAPSLDSTSITTSSKTKGSGESAETWYKTNSLRFTGTASDTDGTGIASVSYQTSADGSSWTDGDVFAGTTSWSGTIENLVSGTTKVKIIVTDNAGNVTESDALGPYNIDMTEPVFESSSVKVNGASVSEENPLYSNGTADVPVTFTASDADSGVQAVYVRLYGKVTDSATDKITASVSDGTYSATIPAASITKSGTVYAQIVDYAGNKTDVNLFALTFDATEPVIQSATLADSSAYTAYKPSQSVEEYYVNNQNGNFTLSGIATDNLGLGAVELSIKDAGSTTITPALTNPTNLSEWSFNIGDSLKNLTGPLTATLTVTDKAKNSVSKDITIKFDTTSPAALHDFDSGATPKDVVFRLGDSDNDPSELETWQASHTSLTAADKDVGGKYAAGTYGKANTIEVRGYFTEEGSGLQYIYYKVFSGSTAPTAEEIADFTSDYANQKTGVLSAITEETKNVKYNTSTNAYEFREIKTNFKSTISEFSEGKNYLVLVGVDYVGNAAVDGISFTPAGSSDSLNCYAINVDVKAPTVERVLADGESSTLLTNASASDINLSGTAIDNPSENAAGIKSVVASITVGGTEYASSNSDKISVATSDSNTKWTVTVKSDLFSSVDSGNFSVYVTATDNAGSGNSQTSNVGTISVDKVKPTVTLTAPSDADTSTADVREINGTIDLSGTIKDANPLPSTAILAVQYMKKESYSSSNDNTDDGWTTLTNAEKGGMENLAISGDYTFDIKNFDTTKIEPLNDVAYYIRAKATDQAGNIGYSSNVEVKVSQDTDRPVIKITNLTDLGESASPRFVLKYGTKSQVIATVTDDDGIQSANDVVISEEKYSGSESIKGVSSYSTTNGTITFTPADDNATGKNVDGPKTFYIYVKDAAGKVFYTTYKTDNSASDYLNVPKVKINDKALTDEADAAVFTYQSDSTSPTVEYIQALAYKSDGTTMNGAPNEGTGEYSEYENVSASYVLGGSEKQKAKFFVTASDASGIAGIALEISYTASNAAKTVKVRSSDSTSVADSTYSVSGTFNADSSDSTKATWETEIFDFSDADTGSVTVKVIPYDKLGLVGNGNATFAVDNSGPAIKISSPASGEECTGEVTVSGTAIDDGSAGTSDIQWIIPTKTERITADSKNTDAEKLAYLASLSWNGGSTSLSSKATVSAWIFDFDGNYDNATSTPASYIFKAGNPKLDVYDSGDFATNSDYATSGLYKLPVYFMATDNLGNRTVYESYTLNHNPDADKPKIEFIYPTKKDYDSEENRYVTLGGTIRVTGSAVIPSGTTTVDSVYIQVADSSASFSGTAAATTSGTDSYIDKNKYGLTIVSAYTVLESVLGSSVTVSSDSDAKKYGFASKDAMDAWWGIKTNGKASWNIALNSNKEMDPDDNSGSTNNITIRACGLNAEGKFGAWTTGDDVIAIHIDNAAPTMTAVVNQYGTTLTSSNIVSSNTAIEASSSQTYESDMYLRGQWYLVLDILDETGVSSLTVKDSNSTLAEGMGYYVATINDGDSGITDTSTNKKGRKVFVPISSTSSSVSYTVTAVDADATGHSTAQTFSFNIDNTAPSMEKIAANGSSVDSADFTSIEDSNYQFILSGSSTDEGSGVEHVLFYFMRKNGTTGTIKTNVVMDPMITSGTEDSKIPMTSLTERTFTQGSETFTLYAKAYSGSATTETFTSDSAYDAHVRVGGLVEIDGILHTISDISGNTVTFSPSLTAAKTSFTAYFPVAQVIDNSATEKVLSYSANPFTFEKGDDGDSMPESFSKSGKTWTWDATIHSTNMPDGPVSLVILAFDNAGNVAGKTISTTITNNAPRLAKVYFGTDLSGDGKFVNNDSLQEIVEYNILAAEGTDQSAYNLDFTARDDKDRAKYANGIFTIKNGLAVISEFTGGNGDIGMVLNAAATNTDKTTGSTAAGTLLVSSAAGATTTTTDEDTGTVDVSVSFTGDAVNGTFTGSDQSYVMQAFVLEKNKLGEDADSKGMSFTFWDSTEETVPGSTSQYSVLFVKNFKVAQTDSVPPTVVINPFWWNSITDNSVYDSSSASKFSELKGHIELEKDLVITKTDGTTVDTALKTQLGADPKVSGKITVTGTAYDNTRLTSLTVKFGSYKTAVAATYDATSSSWSVPATTLADDGYIFIVSDAQKDSKGNTKYYGNWEEDVYFGQKGHKVYWTLSLDTEKLLGTTAVAKDVSLSVTAEDAAGKATATTVTAATTDEEGKRLVTDGTTNVPTYQMDVVPYVVKVTTALSKKKKSNPSVANRTALGHYPVQTVVTNMNSAMNNNSSETVTLEGFNLNHATLSVTGGTSVSSTASSASEMSKIMFNVASLASGKMKATVNSIPVINNINNNDASGDAESAGTNNVNWYNRIGNGDNNNTLTDDVIFDVWEFNDKAAVPFSGTVGGTKMKINQVSGQPNFAFTNGNLWWNMGGKVNVNDKPSGDFSSYYWSGGYDCLATVTVGFHVDEMGYTYGSGAGGDSNTSTPPAIDSYTMWVQRWGLGSQDARSTYGTSKGEVTNGAALEKVGQKEVVGGVTKYSMNKQRIQSPEFASAKNGDNTNLYHAYYDAMNDEIRFKAGTITGTKDGSSGQFVDQYCSKNGESAQEYNIDNVQVVASKSISGRGPGKYLGIAVAKDGTTDVVGMVWYDAYENQLLYSYKVNPIDNLNSKDATATNWSAPKTIFDEGGEWCQIAVDANNHIHIAAFAGDGDLKYAYLESYSTAEADIKTCTVDADGTVGEHLTLDVALDADGNSIPYIGYYSSTHKKPKYAYLVDTSAPAPAGVDENDMFTGAWEVTVVPCYSNIVVNQEEKINVGVWKYTADDGTNKKGQIKNSVTGKSEYYSATGNNLYNGTNWSKTYGNGTANGILAYQVQDGSGSCVETAQMR